LSAEIPALAAPMRNRHNASMEPRFFERGNWEMITTTVEVWMRFNGAALL